VRILSTHHGNIQRQMMPADCSIQGPSLKACLELKWRNKSRRNIDPRAPLATLSTSSLRRSQALSHNPRWLSWRPLAPSRFPLRPAQIAHLQACPGPSSWAGSTTHPLRRIVELEQHLRPLSRFKRTQEGVCAGHYLWKRRSKSSGAGASRSTATGARKLAPAAQLTRIVFTIGDLLTKRYSNAILSDDGASEVGLGGHWRRGIRC